MKEGGKTTFYIPQELAYGARPAPGGAIPPYSALIFEVELIKGVPRIESIQSQRTLKTPSHPNGCFLSKT